MSELPRDSNQLADWYAHLLMPPGERDALEPEEQVDALDVVGLAMAGLKRLIEEGRIANVELSFEITQPEDADPIGFNFSSPGQVTD